MSYGHAYLTSYGWTGVGTGLRKGAISRPLAIPPKKNLSGLGKDRDEAFPFWDHLFTAASKAITIKVPSDDDDLESPSPHTDPASACVPLRRTATGIISNRRPVFGMPASTSGSTTPNTDLDAIAGTTEHLSLIAVAKREAAKRGLYARFFRGPVLGPDDDQPANVDTMLHSSPSSSTSVDSSSVLMPVPDRPGTRDDISITKETKKSEKRKLEEREETREERRERKWRKKERKATTIAKKAEKAEKVKGEKERSSDVGQKAKKQRDVETCSRFKKARKRARKSTAGSEGEQENIARRPPSDVDSDPADPLNVVLTTKKKKAKRKNTPH